MKYLIIALLVVATALVAYDMGAISIVMDDTRVPLANYNEEQCADIIQDQNGRIVCEINMRTPRDNIRVFAQVRN